MFQRHLIHKKAHARTISVHDLLIMGNDLNGDLQRFLLEKENQNRSPDTIRFYREFNTWFIDFLKEDGITQASQLQPEYIMAYNKHLKVDWEWQDVSIATSYRAIRAFCNWLTEIGKIDEGSHDKWRLDAPKFVKKLIKPFQEGELRDLKLIIENRPMQGHKPEQRKLCNLRDRAIILVYTDTAIRLREQSEILLSDIDLNNGIIKISGKNGEERAVPFGAKTKAALSRYIVYRGELGFEDLHLWVNEYGQPLTRWGISSIFKRLRKLANFQSGVRCSSHTFRHTSAISALRNGMDSSILKELLGHKSRYMTDEYLRTINSEDVVKAHAKCSPVQHMDI